MYIYTSELTWMVLHERQKAGMDFLNSILRPSHQVNPTHVYILLEIKLHIPLMII